MSESNGSVAVGVRCRELTLTEVHRAEEKCWVVNQAEHRISLDPVFNEKNRRTTPDFRFDQVFTGRSNEVVYKNLAADVVWNVMEGYHGTVFAYGQTNSGKTYTMHGTEKEPGIIPHAVDDVFAYIEQSGNKREFLLRVSYMEIYNESINDLLSKESNLQIHETKEKGVYVSGLKEEVVTSAKAVMRIIKRGEANRHTSATDYNEHSSRSHTIFQMVVESRESSDSSPSKNAKDSAKVQVSILNLIDLAGSEKVTSNADRKREGGFINRSLLTLGTVISKISEGKGGHVPFRDSKLTRVLQPALGGKAKVAVICTLSPTHVSLEESHNTLLFASRAKNIPLYAQKNEVEDDKALLSQYRQKIKELELQLEEEKRQLHGYQLREEQHLNGTSKETEEELEKLRREKSQMMEELHQKHLLQISLKENIDHLTKVILTSSSISTRSQSTDALMAPESPAKVTPDFLQLRANLNQTNRVLELKTHENTHLHQTLDRLLKAASDLAKACMPLEAQEINQDLASNNPDQLIQRLERITKTMNSQQDLFIVEPPKMNGVHQGGAKVSNGVHHAGDALEELERELEEKAVTIKELEEETHHQRALIQQHNQEYEALSLRFYALMEKKAYGDKSSKRGH